MLLRFYTGVLQQSPVNKYPHACFSNSYDTVYTIIFLYQVMLLLNIYTAAMDACNYNNLVMNILRRHPMHNLELFPILGEAQKFHVRI